MPATPSDLFAFLDRLGIAHATVTHPALFTVEQSQQLRGTIPGGHTKNLFLKDKKGALFLVTALEDAVIELKSLHRRLAASGRFSIRPGSWHYSVFRRNPVLDPMSWTRSARKQVRRRKRVKPDTAGTGAAGAALSLSIANTPADTI